MEDNHKQRLWQAMCFYLSDSINQNIDEARFEEKIIQAFSRLDWQEDEGDIKRRPSLQIGAGKRIAPDLVFYSNSAPVFVIEVKAPSVPLANKHESQLFSYMRQLNLAYGILIGQEIQLFYDDLSSHSPPIRLDTISFSENNQSGKRFVDLFYKPDFSVAKLDAFRQEKLADIQREKDKQNCINELNSAALLADIKQFIQDRLKRKYPNVIESVLEEQDIVINWRANNEDTVRQELDVNHNMSAVASQPQRQTSDDKKRTVNGMKIGEYVQDLFRKLEEKNALSSQEITRLLDKDYSKQTFNVNLPVLRDKADGRKDENGYDRYRKGVYVFHGQEYYLVSQWYETSFDRVLAYEKRFPPLTRGG